MKKRLYKIEEGKKLDGVCGGFAEYLDIDPTVIRVLWVFVTICSAGLGLIGYLACSLIMPRKPKLIE